MKPTFIGLGGQKCASSWLHTVFLDHPEAYVTMPKELDFFSAFYDRGFQWYEAYFKGAGDRRAVGEISPSYLPDSDAPARAYAYNAQFRIIVALRDPVERAYSNHLHDLRLGHYSGADLTFEAGLANNPMYVEQSRYATHLSRWLEYFPTSALLVVLQEDILSNAIHEARRLYSFLGINADHVSDFVGSRSNESYLPRSRTEERFVRSVGFALRKIGLKSAVEGLRNAGVIDAIHRRTRMNIREVVPPIKQATRERLYDALGDETLRLAAILNKESLPWETWRRAASG